MVRTPKPGVFRSETAEGTEMDTDFQILEWQQLANESAMKQELMIQPKMTRVGIVGQPLSTDVRAAVKVATNRPIRGTEARNHDWKQRARAEEQKKPLRVSERFVRQFEQREAETKGRLLLEKRRFASNVKKMQLIRRARTPQEPQLAATVKEDRKNELDSSTAHEVQDAEIDQADSGMDDDDNGAALKPEDLKSPQASASSAERSTAESSAPSRPPEVLFVKTRTAATGNTPSQIIYAVKLRTQPRRMQSAGRVRQEVGEGSKRTRELRATVQASDMEARVHAAKLSREADRKAEQDRVPYQDAVIRQWMLEKRSIERHRKHTAEQLKKREARRPTEAKRVVQGSLPERPKTSEPSTAGHLQRQRQLLLEDYLRKHESSPLEDKSRSMVIAGLQDMLPRVPTPKTC
eukprot:TRINITY_DN5547_c0_g1_i1.p1 TRINITY_DN5547_c0_g1~~TRINITY_DN5547_c0_g1_i1.p1  ORF type:complete len:407 (+),score=88.25 TRINITY_DN5547_c0_g1_i1:63-1283(+)